MSEQQYDEPWREIAETCLGWLHPAEGPVLQYYARQASQKFPHAPLMEIGGYAGKSACWIGAAVRDVSNILYSVDWHRGSPEMAPDRECHHPEMIGNDGLFDSLPHFRANVRRAGLEEWVVPVAGNSTVVGQRWTTALSFLFIDGGHDGETVSKDYHLWAPNIIPGGFLLFHDTTIPEIDAVAQEAVTPLPPGHFEFLEQQDSLRVLRRR